MNQKYLNLFLTATLGVALFLSGWIAAGRLEQKAAQTDAHIAELENARISDLEKKFSAAEKKQNELAAALQHEVISRTSDDKSENLKSQIVELFKQQSSSDEKLTQYGTQLAELNKKLAATFAQTSVTNAKALNIDARMVELDKRLVATLAQFKECLAGQQKLEDEIHTPIKVRKPEDMALISDPRVALLENRLAEDEAQIDKVIGTPERRRATELCDKAYWLRRLRAEYVRQVLLLTVHTQTVQSAKTFRELTVAREMAGQVTKLDVFNAECQLRGRELELLSVERLILEAKSELKEMCSEAEIKSIRIPQLYFAVYNRNAFRDDYCIEIVTDLEARKVELLTKHNDEVSQKTIFEPTPVDFEAVKEAIQKAPALERHNYERKFESVTRMLQQYEKEIVIRAMQVEQGRRSVEAAEISFDRGLKDSFDVIYAENALTQSEVNFISRILDYEIELARLEYLLARGR